MEDYLSGGEIKEIIKKNKNLSQVGLAEKCTVSRSLVSLWLNEKREIAIEYYPLIHEYIGVDKTSKRLSTKASKIYNNQKYEIIKNDLLDQLERQNKFGKHYEELVEHAVYYFVLKDELQHDIENNGIRVTLPTGNRHVKVVDNASIRNLNQVSAQLLRILKDIGLNEPDLESSGFDESDYT